jgi:hypothetical protein
MFDTLGEIGGWKCGMTINRLPVLRLRSKNTDDFQLVVSRDSCVSGFAKLACVTLRCFHSRHPSY